MEIKKITQLSLLLALSVVLNIIESVIPILNGMIPGVKLGLANIITLYVLYNYEPKDALSISIMRVFIVGILRTGLLSIPFFLSLGGSILSTVAMILCKKYTRLSIIGISIIGSIFHSTGQLLIASFLLENTTLIYYWPWIILLAIPTGYTVGFLTSKLPQESQETKSYHKQ